MTVSTHVYPFEIELPDVVDQIVSNVVENKNEKLVIKLPRLKCPYCFYEWIPRIPEPRRCPHCKNIVWRILQLIEKDPAYALLLEGKRSTGQNHDIVAGRGA